MEIQKNLILMSNLSVFVNRYNYRIATRYDHKTGFYYVRFFKIVETKTEIENQILFGCYSKYFNRILSFTMAKIQKIIDR